MYTKGNWYTKKQRYSNGQGLVISEETGENIAVTYKEENAPLVAAAPELLSLLRAYRTTYPLDSYADRADEIIAKTEGNE